MEFTNAGKNRWEPISKLAPNKMVLLRNNMVIPGAILYGCVLVKSDKRLIYNCRTPLTDSNVVCPACEYNGGMEAEDCWEWCEVPQ